MKLYFTATLLLATAQLATAQIPADSIKAIIAREVAAKRSKSIIVGITDGKNRQVYAAGVTSDKDQAMPDATTIYEIGSITKVFTSVVLADMSLKNELSVNDPVSKFLPAGVKAPVRNGKEISLLTLSTNRSGLPRNAYNIDPKNLDNPFATYTSKDLYAFLSNYELGQDIDARWRYSNIGYSLLGDVLSIAAHEDFYTLVDKRICSPLKMKHTFFTAPPRLKLKTAEGYAETRQPAGPWDFPLAGGGGLRSDINDMLTFAEANLGFTDAAILPALELTHVKQAIKDGNDSYVTMGWTLWNEEGRHLVFKDGGTGGYRSFLGVDKKDKIAVVVLSNTNNGVTDIGLHILEPNHNIEPYKYPWALLDTLRSTVQARGADEAIALYKQLKAANNKSFTFNEQQLNHLGTELRRSKKIKAAIKIFKLNAAEYPKSALVYESLAETHKRNKNKKTAIGYFEKAKELDPNNPHWTYMLDKLKG